MEVYREFYAQGVENALAFLDGKSYPRAEPLWAQGAGIRA